MDAASKVNADLQKQLEQQGKTLLDITSVPLKRDDY